MFSWTRSAVRMVVPEIRLRTATHFWHSILSTHTSVASSSRSITTAQLRLSKDEITVHFRKKSGKLVSGVGTVGENLLDVVVNNNLDFDGFGACEGTLACSTCHLILSQEDYDRLPNAPTDEELDMLDLAYGLSDTSRLGCQVRLTKELDGMTVDVPEGINDVRSDS